MNHFSLTRVLVLIVCVSFVSCIKYDRDTAFQSMPLKLVVREDKSFYVRHSIDDKCDGILLFDYLNAFSYDRNCIMMSKYCVGAKTESDRTILAKNNYHSCSDSQSPIFTANFGPLFSNHGYSTPRVSVVNHGLNSNDIGSEWTDQNDYRYTLGHIEGNSLYLLPIINTTGVAGEERRDWEWYASPNPVTITRNTASGETLYVSGSERWDYQVSSLKDVQVTADGEIVGVGTFYCEEIVLSYEQIGYNPISIHKWWPKPVYEDVMLTFDRQFTISGGDGFLSVTSNTVLNNFYPYPLKHYIDVVPQFPFQIGKYKPFVYIPKMVKHDGDIDFREEFVSANGHHSQVSYSRSINDILDVNDMPERAYCYLKDGDDNILFGCAGGHSLVRGMSVPSVRNGYIAMNGQVGSWYPGAGNKHYNNIILNTNEEGNILPSSFVNEFEGYMCWYKPVDDVHCFYHRTRDGYVVYIHTKRNVNNGGVTVPVFMNNMNVVRVVEKTNGMTLHTNTVNNGKVFFSSDNSEVKFNYAVFLVR